VIDVSAFVGSYPFRRVPCTSARALRRALERINITEAWVTHLPGLFWRDPGEGNPWLYRTCDEEPRFRPVPLVHPGLPGWERELDEAVRRRAPAVRCDPGYLALAPAGPEMRALVRSAAEHRLALLLAVRLEDGRQRHPNDVAPELPAASVRQLLREHSAARLLVTHADRGFVEEVHFGSTRQEAERIWWDISWIWGPPEDHLALLLRTVGPARFLFGSGQPLRLPENAVAKLDLLDLSGEIRHMIEEDNARALERW
jgi:predicted TIM-barrel fold metal-dependent hydrolase